MTELKAVLSKLGSSISICKYPELVFSVEKTVASLKRLANLHMKERCAKAQMVTISSCSESLQKPIEPSYLVANTIEAAQPVVTTSITFLVIIRSVLDSANVQVVSRARYGTGQTIQLSSMSNSIRCLDTLVCSISFSTFSRAFWAFLKRLVGGP